MAGAVHLLAHGQRRPSVAMAHALIEGLELDATTV
jgi:hypothetical protein